ncbi:MAG: hypothetical protein AMJ65_01690 [Phycisphaerae bacterium SG8_4]|nr:MAG: hypothetical protein AMJ65_01690 [Phycisphaerae bacterium SG8_4]
MDIFQATVLRSLLHKDCWEAFGDIVTPDIFTNQNAKTLHKHIKKLHDLHVSDLTIEDLKLELHSVYQREGGRREELSDLVDGLEVTTPRTPGDLRPYVQEFAGRELALKAINYVANHLDTDDLDLEVAAEYMERARDLRHIVDADVLDLAAAGLPGEHNVRPMVTSLGLSDQLDSVLCGGVGAGELLIYLAPPSRGKTSYLWATAAAAAAQGRRVLGITLEISAHKCVRRVDQWLSGYTKEELIVNPRTVGKLRRALEESNDGKLWVKDWSYTGITVDDIKALVTRMRQRGEAVDFIIVDYLELVTPLRHNRNAERHNWSQTCKDLRALAVDLQVPIITAWQVNRAGSENHSLTERDVSECWDVVKHADIILGLNQDPAELAEKVLRIGVIKQRESTARPQVYLYSDLDRMIIRDGNEEPDGTEETAALEVDMRDRSRIHGDGDGVTAGEQTGL